MNCNSENPQFLSRGIDYLGSLGAKLRDLQGFATLVHELIQNADDAEGASWMSFDMTQDALIVDNDGVFSDCSHAEAEECHWKAPKGHRCDFHRFRLVASSDKREQAGTIGAFGVGFIAVYQVTDHPELISSGRHWIIHEEKSEDQRIEVCRGCRQCQDLDLPGTRFILPWARASHSQLRKKLRAEAVAEKELREFLRELEVSLSTAMLFLKRLHLIQVKKDGRSHLRFERIFEGDSLIVNDEKHDHVWHLIHGNFNEKAKALREKHGGRIEPKRSAEVTLAIPEESLNAGRFCAFLPTQHETGLSFHINADFFPTNDRKRIVLESDFQSEWNRTAIRAASEAFNTKFDRLRELLDHKQIWQIIESVHRVYENAQKGHQEKSLAVFWEQLSPNLRELPIVFTTQNKWHTIAEVVLLEREEEEEAIHLLEKLDIHIVHHDLRPHFNLLRRKEVGIQLLDLSHIAQALINLGLTKRTKLIDLPYFLQAVSNIRLLWRELDRLYSRQRKPEEQQIVMQELAKCAIALGRDKALWPCDETFHADEQTIALFNSLDPAIPFLANLGEGYVAILQLCQKFSVGSAIEHLERKLNQDARHDMQSRIDAVQLLAWFESRREEIFRTPRLKEMLIRLPIFPSSGGLQPLTILALPGDFADPIGLANLLDTQQLNARVKLLLKELGANELTFRTFASYQIPKAFSGSHLLPEKKRQTVRLLAEKFLEIRTDDEVRRKLADVEIVECEDGVFRKPNRVYFCNDIISEVLGHEIPIAAIPWEDGSEIRNFYAWLGVAHEPRFEEILSRIEVLTSQVPNHNSIRAIQIIFRHLGERLKRDPLLSEMLAPLQSKAWLPARNRSESWFKPNELYTIFREYLFESQANFLAVDHAVQAASPELLRFLRIEAEPRTSQVVEHLLTCSKAGKHVHNEVYRFLNDKAQDPVVKNRLRGQPCLLLPSGYYVRPDQVFWSEHPFGGFRFQLGTELRSYSDLFSVLGVREQPDHSDAIQVIFEIAVKYGAVNQPLDDDAYIVLMNCWRMLDKALESEIIAANDFNELKSKKVIANASRLLQPPGWMFFEDRAGLAAKFDGFLQHNVIPRPQGAWRAMSASGVRALTTAVEPELIECEDPIDDKAFYERVRDRKPQLSRVVESANLAQLDQLSYQGVRDLKIRFSLEAFNQTNFSQPEKVPAHLQQKENTLYFVQQNGELPFSSIARELALFLAPDSEVGPLASGIKEVLAAQSEQLARKMLDELGFPEVDISPTDIPFKGVYVGKLGGKDTPTETEVPTEPTSPEKDETSPLDPAKTGDEAIEKILGSHAPSLPPPPENTQRQVEPPIPKNGKQHPASSDRGHKKTKKRTTAQGQSRLRTYVIHEPGDGQASDFDLSEKRTVIDEAGMSRVSEAEKKSERSVRVLPANHPGYDLESSDGSGDVVRYIEVKSLSGTWGEKGISLTRTQFEKARELGERYWLYVVEWAGQDEKSRIHRIQNPANQVNQFLYDSGWKVLSEQESSPESIKS